MSSIPTKQIDGDVSVGRNVNVGGKANIKGSVSVGHNLKVEGWLDAKNIKGANKGVFTDITKLRETYPDGTLPDGSWAIVGGTLPGELWYVNGGVWVDSGKTAGSVTVDVEQYLEEVQTMSGDIDTMKTDIINIQQKNDTQDTSISTAQNGVTANTSLISKLTTDLGTETSERKSADTTLQNNIDSEAQTRNTADNDLDKKITAEATARANADTTLQTTLQGNIDTETKAREDAAKVLQGNIDALARAGYRFMGIATPETNPGTPTQKVFYIATGVGTYTNFGTGLKVATKEGDTTSDEEVKISVAEGDVAFLMYNGYPPEISSDGNGVINTLGWTMATLDLTYAVEKIVKEKLAGAEGGVAPLNREGVVPMDYLPVEAIRDNLMVSCTQDEYDAMVQAGTVKDDTYYNILEE